MTGNLLLALSGITLLILSLAVYLSSPKKPVNRALTAFLLSGFFWLSANFLTNIASTQSASLFFARTTLIGAALIPLTFLIFVVTYTGYRKLTWGYFSVLAFLPFLIILFTPTDLNIVSIEARGRDTVAGSAYLLLLGVLIAYFSYGVYRLVKFYKKATARERMQLQYIFAGLILTFIPAFITNGILPIFGGNQAYAYGPLSVVAMSVFTTIAIVRHKLLDIRLVVARSLGYILVIGTLAAAFAFILIALTSLFFSDTHISNGVKVAYITAALLLALLYQPLKRVFDRFSNSIFYRDAYDPQLMLNELNTVLVGNIELQRLLEKSASVIADNIKTEQCLIGVRGQDKTPFRLFGTIKKTLFEEQMTEIRTLSAHMGRQKVIITDELEDRHSKLRSILQSNSIAATARLLTHNGSIGYIFLGYKKSGNPYSKLDVRMLDIIGDELVIAIQNALRFEEIQQFNVTLQQKIEEATRELRRVNHRLRELDKTKDEFISMASHQLRTPLTAVKGYLSMVLEGDAGKVSKTQKDYTQKAFDGAQKMVYLIADMLNVSRLQTGKFVIENKPTDLAELVQGEVTQLETAAAEHQIKLVYHKPEKLPILSLDETKTRQVVMNFVDNAIYYTPAGGSVTVELESDDTEVRFKVTDTGLGVPASVQHHLFSKFYRADNARKVRPDGTGLGLFMAKKVVSAQGGAIIFRSTEGKGSVFGFSFPLSATEVKDGKTPLTPKAEHNLAPAKTKV
jgi:signal transduction histidine kinase